MYYDATVTSDALEDPVTHYRTQPPWEFLLTASRTSLQSYELSRLSHAANLRKEISQLLESWVEENSSAMLARWLIERQERPAAAEKQSPSADLPGKNRQNGHTVSDNVLADFDASPPETRGRW